jgi:hypothetical protein
MAEFRYDYTPFATKELVLLVLPFNKYLLKNYFQETNSFFTS